MTAASIGQPHGRHEKRGPWRKSYDVEDVRAQVFQIHWEKTDKNENALKFFDVFAKTVVSYSDHIRAAGKQLPISMNAKAILEALFSVMDGKTGRCDPCLDTIAKRSRLSRRTVVRQLDALREQKIINWVRRTVKTGNAKGEGPQRHQTSNAYFIDMLKLPVEIVRTLRQKLGDKLRETARHLEGSGIVPNRLGIQAERLLKSFAGAMSASDGRERVERRALVSASADTRLALMYGGDLDAMREHEEMLGLSFGHSASATLALYPVDRTIKGKD
ncbi:replication protein A [Novosphingobium sp. Rr 2-17]|uniref:helix-turn-helix domain-containing protein n=1 Tax=Novosphingobium sp. Rr 2-17 TaxID=555793 RepID=UPI000269858A|nr:helix-turn-helix domain-containing protein [Novosphingobium sp. Rr 2-17]EIZ77750.1 replication protein A [Novosphingobium sp. Rr 2-17]